MTKTDNVIKLLLIEDSADEAEQIISMLRNGGIAVRPTRACNEAELEDLLERQSPDLILSNLKCRDLPLRQTTEAVNRTGKDISLIAYGSNVNENDVVEASRDGARALALQNRPDHMQMIVRREFEALIMRRSVRRLENALRESEHRCSDLLDSSRDPIAYVHEGMHVRANRAYLETFGYEDFEDIESMSILDMVAGDDADDFKSLLKRLSKGERPPQKLNLKAQRADGTTFDAVMQFAEAIYEGEPCQQIVFRQLETDPGTTEELEDLRRKDLVTELFNRQHLASELDRTVAAANAGKSDQALILMELDNYKNVLEGIGLGSTDLLLGDMANLLRRHLNASDIAGRMAEYTFGVIVQDRNAEAVGQLVEVLRKTFEERIFEIGKNSINLTISVAASLIVEKTANGNTLLNQVSATLRAAQAEGGNIARVFDPAAKDKADAEKNRHWLKLIKEGLANDGYVLYFQPIISLQGAEGDYYEILLRMKGPRGEILPGFFMPIAEQYGLLPELDRWVISTAIKALAEREQGGRKTTFFIKLAPQSLDDQTLLPWIALQLKNSRQRGDALVFEMPESKVVTSLKPARAFVRGLEQLHCGFALEQFGSGLNSFQLLKHIPAHYLKVDRSYMTELPKNKENQERIKAMCEQAHNAGKLTIAEFVEDAASMSILFSCGINFVQGNFLQEPEQVMSYDFGGN